MEFIGYKFRLQIKIFVPPFYTPRAKKKAVVSMTVFWVVVLCSNLVTRRHFGEKYRLYLQG